MNKAEIVILYKIIISEDHPCKYRGKEIWLEIEIHLMNLRPIKGKCP
jgi:hypothetical protein